MKKELIIIGWCSMFLLTSQFSFAQTNVTTTTGGTAGVLPKFTTGTNIENSQINDNGTTISVNTATPDAYSKMHITLTNSNPLSQEYKGLNISLPNNFSSNGVVTGIYVTGGSQHSSSYLVKGDYTARIGSVSKWSSQGSILGGVNGSVTNITLLSVNGGTSNILGVSGDVVCNALATSIPASGYAYLSGIKGTLSGTVTSYPTPTRGAISSVIGIDYINSSSGTNGYTYAGFFKGRVHIGPYSNSAQTVQQVGSTHADRLLEVDGKIVARKVVTTSQNWADDEFNSSATIEQLDEENDYTKENCHLKGVPSEMEVKENGIEMGEMFSFQVRKIEQLYKYSFLFNAEIKNFRKENELLRHDNNQLKEKYSELEKRILLLEQKNK